MDELMDNELDVDNKLILSRTKLVEEIKNSIQVKSVPKAEKIKSISEYPQAGVLANLALKAYKNFEKEVTLPEGWKLLTTACNKDLANGYYGAAFWHPVQHHVVVSHRGTDPKNFGAVVADLAGIVFNNYAGQMESAFTFAEKIVEAMRQVEAENEDVHFELFFTGHSLGAWLAHVTTFANAFLKRDGKFFKRRSSTDHEPYHAHATVFDSPGALPMLNKLRKKFHTEDRPLDLTNLSLTSYLSAPNQINTCNEHLGRVYRVFVDTSSMNLMDRNIGYTLKTHSIDGIVKCFDPPEQEMQVEEVVEWPIRQGINTQGLETFIKYADYRSCYRLPAKIREVAKKLQIRYRTKCINKSLAPIFLFSKRERQFLEYFRWIRQLPEFESVHKLLLELNTSEDVIEFLKSFEIVDEDLQITDPEKMKLFIPRTKLLLKLFPTVTEMAKEFIGEITIREKVFAFETRKCLEDIRRDLLDFKPSTIDLPSIFAVQFSRLKIRSGKARYGLSMVYSSFEKSEFKANYEDGAVLVMNLKRFAVIDELINFKEFLTKFEKNFLAILYCDENDTLTEYGRESIKNIFAMLPQHPQVKIIVIGDSCDEAVNFMTEQAEISLTDDIYLLEKGVSWVELTPDSQLKVLGEPVKLQGIEEPIRNIVSASTLPNIDEQVLLQILDTESVPVNNDPLTSCKFSVYTSEYEKMEIKAANILESLELSDDIFVITGIYEEIAADAFKSLVKALKAVTDKEKNLISTNLAINLVKFGDKPGKLQVLTTIGSEKCVEDFDEKCRNFRVYSQGKLFHLVKIVDGKLTWRKSYNFERYIPRKMSCNSQIIDDANVFNGNEKVLAIIAPNGEGKTTFLTHFARERMKNSWVIYFNLNKLQYDSLRLEKLDLDSLAFFIANAAKYDTENTLQRFLLRHKLEAEAGKPVHFVFDSFDEIGNDKDRAKAVKLLKFIKEKTKCCLTVATTLPFLSQLSELQPSIYNFEKFTREDKKKLLRECWKSRYTLIWGSKKVLEDFTDGKKSKFENFSDILLDNLDSRIENNAAVMPIPQQMKLLADGFREDFNKYTVPVSLKQKIFDGLRMKTFYCHYLSTKYDLYITTKIQAASFDQRGKGLFRIFQNISVESMLPSEAKELMNNKSEYLSPDYIVLRLTKDQPPPKFLAILTGYLLTDPKTGALRSYINKHDELLVKTASYDLNDETVRAIVGEPMMTVSKEGHDKILDFLITVVKKKPGLKDVILKEEIGLDDMKRNALLYAIQNADGVCVKMLLEFLSEFGESTAFKSTLQRIDKQMLTNFGNRCENSEIVDWFGKFLNDNGITFA